MRTDAKTLISLIESQLNFTSELIKKLPFEEKIKNLPSKRSALVNVNGIPIINYAFQIIPKIVDGRNIMVKFYWRSLKEERFSQISSI